jgi:hypothetical protein
MAKQKSPRAEKRGNNTFRRRVVEERLVYTAFFNL